MSRSTVADPRSVIETYYGHVSAGRFTEAARLLAPDATLWVVGEGHWPLGGMHDVESNKKIYQILTERFPEGLEITLNGLTVEGERVAAEIETYGVRRDGRVYNNLYHYLIIVRDGLIRSRREYLDTIHANDLLCDPMGEEI